VTSSFANWPFLKKVLDKVSLVCFNLIQFCFWRFLVVRMRGTTKSISYDPSQSITGFLSRCVLFLHYGIGIERPVVFNGQHFSFLDIDIVNDI
jgi:hypothetical protein